MYVQQLLTFLLEDMFRSGLHWVLSLVVIMIVILEMGGGVGRIKFVSFSFPVVMSSCKNQPRTNQ